MHMGFDYLKCKNKKILFCYKLFFCLHHKKNITQMTFNKCKLFCDPTFFKQLKRDWIEVYFLY